MLDINLRDATQFSQHNLVTQYLNIYEAPVAKQIFEDLEEITQNAAFIEGKIVLTESQYAGLLDIFKRAYELFYSHFNGINSEVMKYFLIPLKNLITSSIYYEEGAFNTVDEYFSGIIEKLNNRAPRERVANPELELISVEA